MTADARSEILSALRSALTGVAPTPPPDVELPALPGEPGLVARFTRVVGEYGGTVRVVDPDRVVEQLRALTDGRTCVVAAGLEWSFGCPTDPGLAAADLERFEVAVTAATLAIADTGTIVLTHGAGEGRRALSLVPDEHICLLPISSIRPGVLDAVKDLDPRRPQTWISGPSATSDIEFDRVEGVHGPRTLTVLLVDDRPAAEGTP